MSVEMVSEQKNSSYIPFDRNKMLEVKLKDQNDFLKVRETLTRIGIASRKDGEKTLYQSCHILHKRDRETGDPRYYIVSFKELFGLDGRETTLTEEDIKRRNSVALLLEEWGLLEIVSDDLVEDDSSLNMAGLKIIPYKEKGDWNLSAKYNIGNKRKH